ncbi:hypothetical protein [Prosthecomicrobium hirschii]|uniref:hypothetical protein n=1 Tax=Prosthecodimorpha hirschii TaxID=665126 RepID=UPI00128F6B7C|nr:hypothetical protein [Prosthecomicrobium hirschii]
MVLDALLWKPLLEASAQTIVGAIGSYAFAKVIETALYKNLYQGPLDFWMRGLQQGGISEGDQVYIDGLVSPYIQLFPGNPFGNAKKWRNVYDFDGKIDSEKYQAMEFLNGSDSSLRLKSLNGESLIGIFARYGYVGEGLLGVVSTTYLKNVIPDFFHPDFFGRVARIGGRVARCPTQHGFVLQGIAGHSGVKLDTTPYKELYYLQVNSIYLRRKPHESTCSLLGSQWSLTDSKNEQYLLEYGHFSDRSELKICAEKLRARPQWNKTKVYFDEMTADSADVTFSRIFI